MIIGSLIGMVIGVIFARIISEFVLIMFRINEHLGAIRQRGTDVSGRGRRPVAERGTCVTSD